MITGIERRSLGYGNYGNYTIRLILFLVYYREACSCARRALRAQAIGEIFKKHATHDDVPDHPQGHLTIASSHHISQIAKSIS